MLKSGGDEVGMRYGIISRKKGMCPRREIMWGLLAVTLWAGPGGTVRDAQRDAQRQAQRLERRGKWAQAALWRETAVLTLKEVSLPMNEEMRRYYEALGNRERLQQIANDRAEILAAIALNKTKAKEDWRKADRTRQELAAEQQAIDEFLLQWIPHYPEMFFRWGAMGFYREYHEKIAALRKLGEQRKAREEEANLREMAARQYERVAVTALERQAQRLEREGERERAARFWEAVKQYREVVQQYRAEAQRLRRQAQILAQFETVAEAREGLYDPNPEVRRWALVRLAFLDDRVGLRQALAHEDRELRRQAVRYLITAADVPGLLQAAENDDPVVRETARQVLGSEWGEDPSALVEGLFAVLESPNCTLRAAAARALRQLTGKRFGYYPQASPERRAVAIRRWRAWWRTTRRPGLVGLYFADEELTQPIHRRVDAEINFWWEFAPLPELPADHFAVRWTGLLEAPTGGCYVLATENDDGVRLWLDGRLMVDDWIRHPSAENRVEVDLAAGWHLLRIEYFDALGAGTMRLLWQPPTAAELTLVPPERLAHHELPSQRAGSVAAGPVRTSTWLWIGAAILALAWAVVRWRRVHFR
ncbi:MAG TPA: hypothetical protein EYP85_11800 [Armatimonadetes bacterium]|nr:hypothetical protein [Armatimonadota bacterium]